MHPNQIPTISIINYLLLMSQD